MLPDEHRYTALIGSPRFPVLTQDREAGIRCLHDAVANSGNETARERARIALSVLGINVPPPLEPDGPSPDPAPLTLPEPEQATASETPRKRGGWPKGKPRAVTEAKVPVAP